MTGPGGGGTAVVPALAPQQERPHESGSDDQGDALVARVCSVWDRLLRDCGELGQVALMSALTACRLRTGADGGLEIEVPDHRDCRILLEDPQAHAPIIAGALAAHLGMAVPLRVVPAPGVGPKGRYRKAEQDPLVQALKQRFEAEVLAFEPMDRTTWERHLMGGDGPSDGE